MFGVDDRRTLGCLEWVMNCVLQCTADVVCECNACHQERDQIEFRHYGIRAVPSGVSRA